MTSGNRSMLKVQSRIIVLLILDSDEFVIYAKATVKAMI